MKSGPHALGNIKMRGKKYRLLWCGCCEAQNFKDRERERDARKEIRDQQLRRPNAIL